MEKEWAPSLWGRQITRSPDWRLRLDGLELSLKMDGCTHRVNVEEKSAYRIHSGIFWTDITFYPGQGRETKADGLPNAEGSALTFSKAHIGLSISGWTKKPAKSKPPSANGCGSPMRRRQLW